jgi:hypothetical protein
MSIFNDLFSFRGRLVRRALVIPAMIAAGAYLAACDDHHGAGSGTQTSGDLVWQVKTVTDKLTDAKSIEADTEHDMDDGGQIQITGTCNDSAIKLEFAYFAKDDKNSALAMQENGDVSIRYRFDNGDVNAVTNNTDHSNTIAVVFAYQTSGSDDDGAISAITKLVNALGSGPQDLRGFLHARQVRFELPLANGTAEVVSINPQDSGFQSFVSACKIDLATFDADAAKQQAVAKAAADQKAQQDAAAATAAAQQQAEQQQAAQQQAEAAQQNAEAVKKACTTGQGTLSAKGTTSIDLTKGGVLDTWVYTGQVVQPVADPDAVAAGKCSVEFTHGEHDVAGRISLGSLEAANAPPAQAGN